MKPRRRLPLKVERWVKARFVRTRIFYDYVRGVRMPNCEGALHALQCEECLGVAVGATYVALWRFREVEHRPGCETEFLAQVLEASTPQLMRRWKHQGGSIGTT